MPNFTHNHGYTFEAKNFKQATIKYLDLRLEKNKDTPSSIPTRFSLTKEGDEPETRYYKIVQRKKEYKVIKVSPDLEDLSFHTLRELCFELEIELAKGVTKIELLDLLDPHVEDAKSIMICRELSKNLGYFWIGDKNSKPLEDWDLPTKIKVALDEGESSIDINLSDANIMEMLITNTLKAKELEKSSKVLSEKLIKVTSSFETSEQENEGLRKENEELEKQLFSLKEELIATKTELTLSSIIPTETPKPTIDIYDFGL